MATMMLALAVTSGLAQAASSPFELVLALPQGDKAELERKFWSIAEPGSADYLQHLSVEDVKGLLAADEEHVRAATRWLGALGAESVRTNAFGDTVIGSFRSEAAARASPHWAHWTANTDGIHLPAAANHTHPLDYVLRRDVAAVAGAAERAAPPSDSVAQARYGACSLALQESCSTDEQKAHSPFASEPCAVCAGQLQRVLKLAGCTHDQIEDYCKAGRRSPYDVASQKAAYQMPADLAATNPSTLQMVWGPGTFGYDPRRLEAFRNAQCPLLNVDKVHTDGFKGKEGGDNFGEGSLDITMIASFGLNVSTLVSNTNTSMSTEEGAGFGQAMLDFVTSLAERKELPQVLSLSLGSLSPHSCSLLCSEAVKRGKTLAACQAFMQTQRQVCMYISEAQAARIDTALQVLGTRGVSVFGSSGDGGSHWSFGEFPPMDPMGRVLNEIGCEFQFPIYPSPSPYMISVGGTQWADLDPAKPVFCESVFCDARVQQVPPCSLSSHVIPHR